MNPVKNAGSTYMQNGWLNLKFLLVNNDEAEFPSF